MTVYRLTLNDFDDFDYVLIAIHSSLESYRLAYLLNQKLPILLSKNKHDIQIYTQKTEAYFERFTFDNEEEDNLWELIANKDEILTLETNFKDGLFVNEPIKISRKAYVLPEFKKVDYLLKIQNTSIDTKEIVAAITSINKITSAYLINSEQIKSKNNLIF